MTIPALPKFPNPKQTLSYELCKTQKESYILLTNKGTGQEFPNLKKIYFRKLQRGLERNQTKARQKPSKAKLGKAVVRCEFQRAWAAPPLTAAHDLFLGWTVLTVCDFSQQMPHDPHIIMTEDLSRGQMLTTGQAGSKNKKGGTRN